MLKVDEVNSYRKKSVSVKAIKWTGENFEEIKRFAGDNVIFEDGELVIKTLEDGITNKAKHIASVGDFVIQGIEGEFYFCKPDMFEQTYEVDR